MCSYKSDRLGSSSTSPNYELPWPPCTDPPMSVPKQGYLQLKLPGRIGADLVQTWPHSGSVAAVRYCRIAVFTCTRLSQYFYFIGYPSSLA